jgi:hypothetical protein
MEDHKTTSGTMLRNELFFVVSCQSRPAFSRSRVSGRWVVEVVLIFGSTLAADYDVVGIQLLYSLMSA